MDMKFDLFKLHFPEEDKDPRWSWIRASGKDLVPYTYSLIKELTNKSGTNNVAKKINVLVPRLSIESILNYFWSIYEKFPLVFLEALSKQFKNQEEIKQKIQNKIEVLSISRYDSKPIKALKELNLPLCKLAGAHAADGALWGEYNYQLIDHDKLAVQKFCSWLNECFGYSIKPNQPNGKNAWTIIFKSRIIGRYLNKFLSFPIGNKCDIVKEPPIIKKSNPSFRKAFALGVMTFDGSVDCRGMVALTMKSKDVVTSVYQIVSNNGVRLRPLKYSKCKDQCYFQSNYRNPMLLRYFEENTEKWYKLKELVYGFQGKVTSLKEAKLAFDRTYSKVALSKVSFSDIIKLIPSSKPFTNKDIISRLKGKNIDITSVSLGVYLHILRNAKIIQPSDNYKVKKYKEDNRNIILKNDFRQYFFKKIRGEFQLQRELAHYLGRTQSIISNYIHGRRSIPIYDLEKMAKLIKIDKDTLNKNVIKLTHKTPTYEFYRINKNINEWRVPWRPYLNFVEVVKNEK